MIISDAVVAKTKNFNMSEVLKNRAENADSAVHRRRAIWALLLLVPAPSIGLFCVLHLFPDATGRMIFGFTKLWILVLPAVWVKWVDREAWSWPGWPKAGMGVGLLSGVVIAAVILAAYFLLGRHWVDPDQIHTVAASVGLDRPSVYIGAAVYWCVVNSVLEEYVWRWFVYRKCEILMSPVYAVIAAAFFFTVHHVIALVAYFDLRITIIGALGVFTGGAIWSWCYLRFRSIWPGYVSHVGADVAVFLIGYILFFHI